MRTTIVFLVLMLLLSSHIVLAQDDAEVTNTPQPQITITIWWPDTFARVNETEINPALIEQTDNFLAQMPSNITVEHRLKAVGQTGGIMSTLRSASNVARGALPTLALIQRQDLIFAQNANYIRSLEGFSSVIQGDLNNALELGQVNNTLYGVPYLLDFQHVVYRPTEDVDYDSWAFDDVIARGEPIAFPAGRLNSLNDVLALQYIAGGGLPQFSDAMIVSEAAVTPLFEYYTDAVDTGLINADWLDYAASSAYLSDFMDGDINAGVFSSTRYLRLRQQDDSLEIAPIPTADGEPISFINGWMWVLIAQDNEEQEVAIDYLTWMFEPQRQAEVAREVLMLPSRESAFDFGLAYDTDPSLYLNFIDNAVLPLNETTIGVVGRELQTQFASILTLETTTEEATSAITDLASD